MLHLDSDILSCFFIFYKIPLGFYDVNVTAAPFARSAIKVGSELDRSLKPPPLPSNVPLLPAYNDEL